MKKLLLISSLALATSVSAQFSSGVVNLGSTGMTVKLDTTPTLATITLTGNSTSFFGIGRGNQGMSSGADGFIYNSTSTTTTNLDYTFSGIGVTPTADAVQDWTITSNTVSGTTRTLVATRSLSGGTGDTPFSNAAGSVDIFFARGTTMTLVQHSGTNRGYATLTMTASLGTNDLQAESKKVVLYPNPAKEMVSFKNADKIKSIDMYESTGRKVKSVKLESDNISVSDLKSGNYYLEITLKDGSLSYEKLIKE